MLQASRMRAKDDAQGVATRKPGPAGVCNTLTLNPRFSLDQFLKKSSQERISFKTKWQDNFTGIIGYPPDFESA